MEEGRTRKNRREGNGWRTSQWKIEAEEVRKKGR